MSVRWRKGAHGFTLHRGGRGPALATVEPDALYPGMWRVRMSDGRYSNMVNLVATTSFWGLFGVVDNVDENCVAEEDI
jgi:hypothetical protein